MKKMNKVKKILDGKTSLLKLKDYIMFEDNWITEHDKILYNENGESFPVLDFQEIEEDVFIMDTLPYESGRMKHKFSCVKLDKNVNVGDIFYTYL